MKSTQVALYLCPPTHLAPPPPTTQANTLEIGKSTLLPYETLVAVADQLNAQLRHGDYSAVINSFDDVLKVTLPEYKLKQNWELFIQQYGELQPKRSASGVVNSKDHYDAVATF
ncbi:MAG TPA: hypothetical protein VMP08_06355, partial [Anaerolineae bacterium]|nr:hypothetical protein [Anaerolineae bacterium]